MSIYFIDPVNGDNANDGLTPGAAFASPVGGLSTLENPAEYFLRRGTVTVVSESIFAEWFTLRGWPMSDSTAYATRPQAGIDAGWDDDVQEVPKLQYGIESAFNSNSANADTVIANFEDLVIECTTTGGNNLLSTYAVSSVIKNVKFIGDKSMMRIYKFYSASAGNGTNGNIQWENVEIDNLGYGDREEGTLQSIIFYNFTGDAYYPVEISMKDVKIRGAANLFYNYGSAQGILFTATLDNVDLVSSAPSYPLNYLGGTSSNTCSLDLTIKNGSRLYSATEMFPISQHNSYNSKFKLVVEDSELASASPLISSHTTNSSPGDHILGVDIINSTIDAPYLIRKYNDSFLTAMDNISIQDSTLKNMSYILFLEGYNTSFYMRGNGVLRLTGNTFDEVENIIYTKYPFKVGYIEIIGQALSGHVIAGPGHDGDVFIEDSLISKAIVFNGTINTSIKAIGSTIDGVSGVGVNLDALGCRIDGSSYLASNGATIIARDSHLSSSAAALCDENSSIVAVSSNVQFSYPVEGSLVTIGSSINGASVNEGVFSSQILNVSSSKSADGASSSRKIDVTQGSSDVRVSINTMYALKSANNVYTMFLALPASLDATKVIAKVQYIDSGKLVTVSVNLEDDSVNDWEALAGYSYKKITTDLGGATAVPIGSKIRFLFSVPRDTDDVLVVYVDKNVVEA